jgi:small glutamine-rich tetratricopeptide repeat-containing protein alpha
VTPEQRAAADRLKGEGNVFMKEEKYEEALECYSKAIEQDGQNAVYYCNR